MFNPLANPVSLSEIGGFMYGPTKSDLCGVTEMLAPESQMMGNDESFGMWDL
jgi:hypothetical protein